MNITHYSSFPDYSEESFDLSQYFDSYISSNVIIDAKSSDVYYPPHNTTLTIKTVLRGEEHYTTKKCRYRVTENNFLLINPTNEYDSRIEFDSSVHSFAIFFSPQFIENVLSSITVSDNESIESPSRKNYLRDFPLIEKLYEKDRKITSILSSIKNASESISGNEIYIEEQMIFLLEYLFHTQEKIKKEINKISSVRKSTKLEIYKRLNTVKDYIESCYNERIKLTDLAKNACMCEHHMLREFKKYFHITPHQYLTNIRLEKSKEMLSENHKAISEISSAIGFEHQSSFSQLFVQKYKISPMKFRQLASSKSQF